LLSETSLFSACQALPRPHSAAALAGRGRPRWFSTGRISWGAVYDGDDDAFVVDLPATPRPLIATADDGLLDDILRLCAAAAVTPDLAADSTAARRMWRSAGLVVLGRDVAELLSRVDLPRRDGVIVVTRAHDDATVWQSAVRVGAEEVVVVPEGEAVLAERIADTLDETGRRAATVAVTGARGGAGSSILAGALALVAGRTGHRTLVIDGDPLGGGIDLVLGGEAVQGLRWPDLAATSGRVSGPALRSALPEVDGVAVLSWDRGDQLHIPAASMRTVLAAGQRGCDVVVVDLPRRVDDAAIEALASADTTLLVVPAQVRALAAAQRIRNQISAAVSDVRIVVRGPMESGLTPGLIADNVGLPLIGSYESEDRVAADVEAGFGPHRRSRSLRRACERIVECVVGERAVA
jgi:secretion/DNA translocation related CpaE-like protein